MQNSIIGQGVPSGSPAVPKLERQRLHDTVVDYLRNAIVEAVLTPGTKLNERELCETLGISRTPLRDMPRVSHNSRSFNFVPGVSTASTIALRK